MKHADVTHPLTTAKGPNPLPSKRNVLQILATDLGAVGFTLWSTGRELTRWWTRWWTRWRLGLLRGRCCWMYWHSNQCRRGMWMSVAANQYAKAGAKDEGTHCEEEHTPIRETGGSGIHSHTHIAASGVSAIGWPSAFIAIVPRIDGHTDGYCCGLN